MNADELFEKCWNEDKFGHTNDRKTLAYYAFIEGMQQVKNLNIPAVVKSVCVKCGKPIDDFDKDTNNCCDECWLSI